MSKKQFLRVKHQDKFRHRLSSHLKNKSIGNLDNPIKFEHLFYFLLFFQKTNYEFGGFKGYKFGLVRFFKNFIMGRYKNFEKTSVEYETNLLENAKRFNPEYVAGNIPIKPLRIRVLTLFPSTLARNDQEVKSSMLLNIISSAESAGVYFNDYHSDVVSDFSKFNDSTAMIAEWEKISKIIENKNINTVIILGHKNSFCEINGQKILEIRNSQKVKVLLYLTDNWNSVYSKLVTNWYPFVDHIISYDNVVFDIVPSGFHSKIIIWSIGPKAVKDSPLNVKNSNFTLYFGGTCYLNRWAWSYLVSCWHKLSNSEMKLDFDYRIQPIVPGSESHRNIRMYRSKYSGKNLATFHFLERHPNISSLTSSVLDGFAGASLVVVQTNKNQDPVSNFFRPNIDYLVFSSFDQLIFILNLLETNPELGRKIAKNGFESYKAQYEPVAIWNKLEALICL
jgi:hypothetical protein